MRTLRSAYFIVIDRSWGNLGHLIPNQLLGPNIGIGYKTRQAAEAALKQNKMIEGSVSLFVFKKEPKEHPIRVTGGYFSTKR